MTTTVNYIFNKTCDGNIIPERCKFFKKNMPVVNVKTFSTLSNPITPHLEIGIQQKIMYNYNIQYQLF